eukprot:2356941-Alexandrium_andersonii.AAC.1
MSGNATSPHNCRLWMPSSAASCSFIQLNIHTMLRLAQLLEVVRVDRAEWCCCLICRECHYGLLGNGASDWRNR